MALLFVLMVLGVAVPAGLAINLSARNSLTGAAAVGERTLLKQTALAGIHLAMAILALDREAGAADSLKEDWADPVFLASLAAQAAPADIDLHLAIADERSRLNVNALVSAPDGREFISAQFALWLRLLTQLGDTAGPVPQAGPIDILNALKDWMDANDGEAISGLNGAESSYYRRLVPPYRCANQPLRAVEELLLVKGVAPPLFYGGPEQPALETLITVWGMSPAPGQNAVPGNLQGGRININTAPEPLLAALLPAGLEVAAAEMAAYRQDVATAEILATPDWYRAVPGLGDVTLPVAVATTASDIFRITVEARRGDSEIGRMAVVQRVRDEAAGVWRCRLLALAPLAERQAANDDSDEPQTFR
jgi:general secretion pathway protein K